MCHNAATVANQVIFMSNHKINWVNDHTQICDRFDERVQLMQDYLDSKPDDFDGIAVKRAKPVNRSLGIGSQLTDSILSELSPAVAPWKPGNPLWSTISLPTTSEYKRDPAFPTLSKLWSRPNDERDFQDARETPDTRIFDLR